MRELRPDVAILSELYRNLIGQSWETDAKGKAVVWACNKLPFQEKVDGSEGQFVRAKISGIHIYSCYAPPSMSFEEYEDFLDRLMKDTQGRTPVVIASDFNAWAIDWGSKRTNKRGHAFLEALSTLDLVLLNTGSSPIYVKEEATSIIDLTFVSSSLTKDNTQWKVTDACTNSDHHSIGD